MQVTCYGDRRGGQLVAHDVVTAGEGYTHLWRDVDTAVESDGLRDVAPVSGGSVVDVAYRIADHVVESDIPRHREVVVCLRHVLPSQYGVHRAVGIVERVDVFWRYGVDVVDGGLRAVLSRLEGVTETPAGADDTSRKASLPHQLVVAFAFG